MEKLPRGAGVCPAGEPPCTASPARAWMTLRVRPVGPALKLAARLCERAESDQAPVDQRTVGRAGDSAGAPRFESLGRPEFKQAAEKGFSQPVLSSFGFARQATR